MRRDAARHDVRGTRRYRYTNTVHRIFYRPRNGTRCGSWSDEYRTFPSFQGKRIKQLLLPLLLLLFFLGLIVAPLPLVQDASHAMLKFSSMQKKISSKESNINFCSSQVSRFLSLDLASADLSILVLQWFRETRAFVVYYNADRRKKKGGGEGRITFLF